MDSLIGLKLYHLEGSLPERRVLKLQHARGARIVSVAGDVWITEDGRYDDVVLATGESTILEHDGMTMITPFGSADVEVVLPIAESVRWARPKIDIELVQRHATAARRLRAQAMAGMFTRAVEWVRARLRPAARPECCA